MFGDDLGWNESDSDDIWECQIWSATILDFFPKGLAYHCRSQLQISFKFVYSQIEPKNNICLCLRVKLRWFCAIWRCQIWSAAILDFFSKGLAYDFGSKYQISLKFVYSQFEPKNNICWCLRVKLKWFWRYMRMSNFISRHLGFFSKGVSLWFWIEISNVFKVCIWSNWTWKWCLVMF